MRKALVTGSEGFVGSHLTSYLTKFGFKVLGSYHRLPEEKANGVEYIYIELKNKKSIRQAISRYKPSFIFHLAAKSSTPFSFSNPEEAFAVNIFGTINLYEVIREMRDKHKNYDPIIVQAGSSEAFGKVFPREIPIKENQPFRAVSPYGASKAALSLIGYQYFKAFDLKIIRLNLFTHTGPRQKRGFFVPDMASQIAEIEIKNKEPVIRVGNLESIRDYTDVRDIVKAYRLAALKCEPGEAYNVCSGKKTSIKEVLNFLASLSKKKITIEVDPARFRKVETALFVGNPSKFKKATGWENEIPIEKTLEDTLNWWRTHLS